ncbi:MAG: YraN family protein, partial [Fimbriimonadaceae bacterium]
MSDVRRIGAEAEDEAARYLLSKGLTLVARRRKLRRGEIDLIALDGETIVFVEVKWRSGPGLSPEEAVDARKRARIAAAAEEWLSDYVGPARPVRFDVVALDRDGIRHLVDAFSADEPAAASRP